MVRSRLASRLLAAALFASAGADAAVIETWQFSQAGYTAAPLPAPER